MKSDATQQSIADFFQVPTGDVIWAKVFVPTLGWKTGYGVVVRNHPTIESGEYHVGPTLQEAQNSWLGRNYHGKPDQSQV